ncbi:MAG TPA: hypothetical protein VK988_19550 [Acidimicrobiales bacterium]|nr:hypothetical protein [Acidimicrobiales bacterium]
MLTELLGEELLASLGDALNELLAEALSEALFDTLLDTESASAAVTVAPAGLATSTMGAAAPPLSVNATAAAPTTLHPCSGITTSRYVPFPVR